MEEGARILIDKGEAPVSRHKVESGVGQGGKKMEIIKCLDDS